MEPFRHEALLYEGETEFVDLLAAFIRDGIAADEPTLVVVGERKLDLLRQELGDVGDTVQFADMAAVGRNPARIIPAWQSFVARHAQHGMRLRGIGEPIYPERDAAELVECQRHESLLNLAFADASSFWLVCPYDIAALPDDVIEEARRSHPLIAADGRHEDSSHYSGLEAIKAPFAAALSPRPRDASDFRFDGSSGLDAFRRFAVAQATEAGLGIRNRVDFVVAVSELAKASLVEGDGEGTAAIWREGERIVCEIRSRSRLTDPLGDRQLPADGTRYDFGLWVANQLCDLVQVRSSPDGTVARLYVPRD